MYISDEAKIVVKNIIGDIESRSGLNDVWDSIDRDTRVEIAETWARFVDERLQAVNLWVCVLNDKIAELEGKSA